MNESIARGVFWTIGYLRRRYFRLMDRVCTTRFSREFLKCGQDIRIYYPCLITGPQFVEMGDNVHLNRGAFVRAEGGLKIGDNVHIARNLTIYTINHNYMGNALPYDNTVVKKSVVIERNVWIGINVTIVPGVKIGEGAIIGAGTVVTRDIPPLAIVGSQSPKIIKYRDEAHYALLDRARKYGGPSGRLYRREE